MTEITSRNWTEQARTIINQLARVAQDQLETATNAEQATAGPQEVVDALEIIINELETVQNAIPAQPSSGEQEQTQAPPQEEERPVTAKLASEVKELQAKLEQAEKEKIANEYADLFSDSKTSQQKFDEVLKSEKDSHFWSAKIDSIKEYQSSTGNTPYRPAKNFSTNIKVAQNQGLTHL